MAELWGPEGLALRSGSGAGRGPAAGRQGGDTGELQTPVHFVRRLAEPASASVFDGLQEKVF